MAMSNKTLADKAYEIATKYNTVYGWGMYGARIDQANIDSKANQYPSYYDTEYKSMLQSLIGKNYWGFDCVNLIKGIVWGWSGDWTKSYGGASYATNNCPDYGADSMIEYCTNVSTNFSNLKVGEALWCSGHFGVYIGNGLGVESTPRWGKYPGVKVTAVANMGLQPNHPRQRTWTKHGFMPFITYSDVSTDIGLADTVTTTCIGDSLTVGLNSTMHLKGTVMAQTGMSLNALVNSNAGGYWSKLGTTGTIKGSVFICLGTNDLGNNMSQSSFTNNYKKLIERIHANNPESQIYISTIPPIDEDKWGRVSAGITEANVVKLNAWIKSIANSYQYVELVNSYSEFIESGNKMPSEYTTDGVHMTSKGYTKWYNYIFGGNSTTDITGTLATDNDYSNNLSGFDLTELNYSYIYSQYESVKNLTSQPCHVFVDLWIGDKHLPNIPPNYLLSLTVQMLTGSGDSGGSAVEATISLFDKYCDELEYLFIKGQTNVSIRFGHVNGNSSVTYHMKATEYNIDFKPAGNIITVKCTSDRLAESVQMYTGNYGTSPSYAVRKICENVGWKIGNIVDSVQVLGPGEEPIEFNLINDKPVEYIVDVIAPKAATADGRTGFRFTLDASTTPNTANFEPYGLLQDTTKGLKTYLYQKGIDSPVLDFSLNQTLTITPEAITSYISSGIDPLTKEEFNITSNVNEVVIDSEYDKTTIAPSNPGLVITDGKSREEVSINTNYRFINNATINNAIGVLTIVGDLSYSIGSRLRLIILNEDNSMHNLSGIFYVNQVSHNISSGTLITTLEINKVSNVDGTVVLKSSRAVGK